jgi:hypothetical protein
MKITAGTAQSNNTGMTLSSCCPQLENGDALLVVLDAGTGLFDFWSRKTDRQ